MQVVSLFCFAWLFPESKGGSQQIFKISWYQEPKFLFKMPLRRSEGEESEYPFFKVFDDDQYEKEIENGFVRKVFVDNYLNFQEDENNVSFSGVVLGVEEESMLVYDTDIEDVIKEEEGFVRK
ncbi:hypothetical protein Tco_1015133 [Tanacetum coccineum]|uniref:Uncharacterized protein n=1 Tax=Tanacetum coccineum TaxID=301880 RepID=A0ABQ5FKZ4_9ASTR